MAEHAAKGKQSLTESNYQEAVQQYTLALKITPTSPDYLIQRSTAYQRSQKHEEALADAEAAVVYAQQRAKKELIIQAQLRRGIALFGLERYGDAKVALEVVKRMDPKEKSVDIWLSKTSAKISALSPGDVRAKVTIQELPELESKEAVDDPTSKSSVQVGGGNIINQTPADKVRHDWYQNNNNVFFSLLAKGVPKDKVTVEITSTSLSISYPIESNGSIFEYSLDPLFASVVPGTSSHKVLSTKLEVVLVKAQPGQKWTALEGTEQTATDTAVRAEQPNGSHITKSSQAPTYPTSAKGGTKNWDKIVSENGEVGDDNDEIGGDDASKFFKQLYKGASAETQRAMMKSYIESNGTALSTDWSSVSKGKVETVPPDGMVQKKWTD